MPLIREKIVAEDINLGRGTVSVTTDSGGQRTANKVGIHTLLGAYFNVKDFGAVGDDVVDDTVAINNAVTALLVNGGILFFPQGTYRYAGSTSGINITADNPVIICGAGAGNNTVLARTIIKNTSTTGRLMSFGGSGSVLKDLALDNNTSTGICLRVTGAYSRISNVELKGQRGTNFALEIASATFSQYDNLRIWNSTNGIKLDATATGGTNFQDFYHCSVDINVEEAGTVGRVFEADNGVAGANGISNIRIFQFGGDRDFVSGTADQHNEFIYMRAVTIASLHDVTEETSGAFVLNSAAHWEFVNCTGISIYGGRIFMAAATTTETKTLLRLNSTSTDGISGITIENMYFQLGAGHSNKTLIELMGSQLCQDVRIRNITTLLQLSTTDADTTFGIKCSTPTTGVHAGLIIEGWRNRDAIPKHTLNASDMYVVNLPGRSSTQQTVIRSQARQYINNATFTVKDTDATLAAGARALPTQGVNMTNL